MVFSSNGGVKVNNFSGIIRLALAGLLLSLGACASVVEGTDQTVTVKTIPAGANCELSRDGQTIGVVNPTPGSVLIDKSKDAVSVNCTKEGHDDGAETMASSFQGMTFGNILIGGIIGIGIDAASGAMHFYPDSVEVFLIPNSFASAADRDAFFDQLIARRKARGEAEVQEALETCKNDPAAKKCDSLVQEANKVIDSDVDSLEAKRATAKLDS